MLLKYGGVVYSEDNAVPSQCNFHARHFHNRKRELIRLPYCFFQFTELVLSKRITVDSIHDSASKDGHFLYGGLFDRCRIPILNLGRSVTKLERQKYLNFKLKRHFVVGGWD